MRFWKPRPVTKAYRVGLGVATYLNGDDAERRWQQLNGLLCSLRAQTYPHWQALIVHDGPVLPASRLAALQKLEGGNVRVQVTPERKAKYGHPHRQATLEALTTDTTWVGLTNDDNYYAPVYLEWLVSAGERVKADLVHCDCVHSHRQWRYFPTAPKRGKLDLGGFLVRSDLAKSVPFTKFDFAGDGDWVNRLAAKAKRIEKVGAVLFVHN